MSASDPSNRGETDTDAVPPGRLDELLRLAEKALADAQASPNSEAPRLCGFLLVDLYKCMLDESGTRAHLAVIEADELPVKLSRLRSAVPSLTKWTPLIMSAQRVRVRLFHSDYEMPELARLKKLLQSFEGCRSGMESEIDRRNAGFSDEQLLDEYIGSIDSDLERLGAGLDYTGQLDRWQQTHVELASSLRKLKENSRVHDPPSLTLLLEVARWCATEISNVGSDQLAAAESDHMADAYEAQYGRD